MFGCLCFIVNNISDVSSRKGTKTQRGEEAKKKRGKEVSLCLFFFALPLLFFSLRLCAFA
jgi:hypothetical protein